ncbi:serine/threonine-protein kinase [Actinoplanes sp. NBRC 103695]|uniref:serine/threonine-protein kinase n=1 Tax=Actinoplanes sp. NBRC 103695 TaxID=3032202 RepID=UPI0024A47111|nr:serine/threonine-protein kinase [Actinoplanes sp. NBRC 103695]GLZ01447.1 serine/threonine protein kinase [Actinoplanes sp. NBRC 103695]
MVGRLANRYRLLDRLGAGGMSVVWRAHDEVLDREVAIKVLSPDQAISDRILVEARAAARLRHPHVIEVYDFGRDPSFVVMELVDGRSLADVLSRGPLPWRAAVTIGAQVAAALAAAHGRGIVHRDVKPANVMVTSAGVKLVDFGISASTGEADLIGGQIFGTPAYLAPERIDGGPVRPATDVYALGLLLHLMLAGRLPWDASTTTQMLRAHRYRTPQPLPPVAGLPDEVATLIRRCLAKEPAARPDAATAARVLSDAAGLITPPPLLAALDAPTEIIDVPATHRHPLRRRLVAAGASTAAVVVAVAGVVWFAGRDESLPSVRAAGAVPPLTCQVGYAIKSALNGTLSTAVTVRNTGRAAASDWKLTFELPSGQKLVRGWSSGWAQDGQALLLTGRNLAAGGKVSTGFDASYRESAGLPGEFKLNDTVCTPQLSVAGQTTRPPATSPAATFPPATPATSTTTPATAKKPAAPPAPPKPEKKDNSGHGKGGGEDNSGPGKGP